MDTTYAIVGNFSFRAEKKGLTFFRYEAQTGRLIPHSEAFEEVSVGQQYFNPKNQILYFLDERRDQRGFTGGGGTLLAAKVSQETGTLTLLNKKPTLAVQPCSLCLDRERKHLLVVHHGSDGYVTKIEMDEEGHFKTKVAFDDTALVAFRLEQDGSIGDVSDIAFTSRDAELGEMPISKLHSVVSDPTGTLFAVNDLGLGEIRMYSIEQEKGLLNLLSTVQVNGSHAPRYGVFHPTLPFYYCNDEEDPLIHTFSYTQEGRMSQVSTLVLKQAETGLIHPCDLIMHPNGKHLYVSLRDANEIILCDISEKGRLSIAQTISCQGKTPRGLTISPDARFLYVMNKESAEVVTFALKSNGAIEPTGEAVKVPYPANLVFV